MWLTQTGCRGRGPTGGGEAWWWSCQRPRASDTSARVTLLDGRRFVLRGSNGVNDENKGIFIRIDDGETVMLDWDEFERVEFRNQPEMR